MVSASEKRAAVIRKHEEILGRNKYSQPRRSYAFKKYSDGQYYSDCSSSVALAVILSTITTAATSRTRLACTRQRA